MSNTHAIADTAYELQATCEDLLPACVISTTWPTVPVSSMTLAAFATQAYVRDGQALVYCDQPAITLTLSGSAGTYWLGITRDTSTAYATWTRRPGSQYVWQLAGARPPDVDGLLVMLQVTVAGGVITAVTPAPGVTRAERWRTLAALGTMATQNANAVAITGGTATLDGILVQNGSTFNGNNHTFNGSVGFNRAPEANAALSVQVSRPGKYGIFFRQNADTGTEITIVFHNAGGTMVGSINSTGSATAFNTTSDVRLKEFIQTLVGALDVVRALRPVSFHWQADGSRGNGFLAHELMQVIPEAVSGLPDEVNPDGTIKPQQVDHSRILPWAIAGMKELLTMVEGLQARVTALEESLGL